MKPYIFPSSIETARALILYLIKVMGDDSAKIFHIAFSGGSTPALMFDLWANEYKNTTPWHRMRIYWVDERCVRPDDSDSNYGMMRSLLLSQVPISGEHVFRIKGEDNPEQEAVRYTECIREELPFKDGFPVFDIVLLGAGDDGHTSSIFPGSEELLSWPSPFVATRNPTNGQKRIAMTGVPILNASRVIFLITGKSKAKVVADICTSGDTGPAAYIAHHSKRVELFIDHLAATNIV